MWTILQEPRQVADVTAAIIQEYDVEPEQCSLEILALLERLKAESLLEIVCL